MKDPKVYPGKTPSREKHKKIKDYTKVPQKATKVIIRIVPFNLFILFLTCI